LNPKTNRCVKIDGKIGIGLISLKKSSIRPSSTKQLKQSSIKQSSTKQLKQSSIRPSSTKNALKQSNNHSSKKAKVVKSLVINSAFSSSTADTNYSVESSRTPSPIRYVHSPSFKKSKDMSIDIAIALFVKSHPGIFYDVIFKRNDNDYSVIKKTMANDKTLPVLLTRYACWHLNDFGNTLITGTHDGAQFVMVIHHEPNYNDDGPRQFGGARIMVYKKGMYYDVYNLADKHRPGYQIYCEPKLLTTKKANNITTNIPFDTTYHILNFEFINSKYFMDMCSRTSQKQSIKTHTPSAFVIYNHKKSKLPVNKIYPTCKPWPKIAYRHEQNRDANYMIDDDFIIIFHSINSKKHILPSYIVVAHRFKKNKNKKAYTYTEVLRMQNMSGFDGKIFKPYADKLEYILPHVHNIVNIKHKDEYEFSNDKQIIQVVDNFEFVY
jgi:hypothetical protein